MALRIGRSGPASEGQVVLSLRPHGCELETTTTLRAGAGFGLPTAMNYQLRTGADKGNPTV